MSPKNQTEAWTHAPLEDLLKILLGQVRRLLAVRQVNLTDDELNTFVRQVAESEADPALVEQIRAALVEIVSESEHVLNRWGLTFAESLVKGVDEISGWETTAEFLEIANEKVNAEQRISTGSSLLAALGDMRYASYLLDLIAHDAGSYDINAVIAWRMLLAASRVSFGASDWLNQVTDWLKRN